MTFKRFLRTSAKVLATLATLSLIGCQYIIGLDDYELAPICPVGAINCKLCNKPSDCDPVEPCHTWSCVAHLCQPINAQPGTTCPTGVCSDVSPSTCVGCNLNSECDPGAYCYEHACYRCDDGIMNGGEWDVDCGGTCPACLAFPCLTGAECKSGFCADNRCCDGPCDDIICAACYLPGNEGHCSNVPQYDTDPNTCKGGYVCDGSSGCRKDLGADCIGNLDCASLKCVNNICVP